MIRDLQRVKELNGGDYFTKDFYQRNGDYGVKTLTKHFDCSWKTLLQKHLLLISPLVSHTYPKLKIHQPRPNRVSEYSDEDLLVEMKRVWEECGRRPSYSEFKNLGRIGVHIYEHRYGNWAKAITSYYVNTENSLIGLSTSHATSELLLYELNKLTSQVGIGRLSFKKYRERGGTYSIGAFQNHFGSWKAAVHAVGHSDGHARKYQNEELFSEIQRLWEMYGRQPTCNEMRRDGQISLSVFERRFGSWMKAVHSFCDDRELPDEEDAPIEAGSEVEAQPRITANEQQPMPTLPDNSPLKFILVDSRRVPGKKLRFRVLQRDKHQCVYCGRSREKHGVVIHVDHIIAWSRGGLTVFENLQTTCEDCNLGKSDSLIEPNSVH